MSGGRKGNAPAANDVRWGWRRPCGARVTVSTASGPAGTGRLRDVSMSGAFLETALAMNPGTRISVEVLARNAAGAACVQDAMVVRIAQGGVGIEWLDVGVEPLCERMGCANGCAAEEP